MGEFHIDWAIFKSIVISLALGGIVGLERQSRREQDFTEASGIRTFALASLLGTLVVFAQEVSVPIAYIVGAGYLMLVLLQYIVLWRDTGELTGITTQVAALLVFVLGGLVPGNPVLAASVAVIVALLLAAKRYVHRAVDRLSQPEVYATLKFLLVTVVLLPLLPDAYIDPWGIYNPQELWFLVVLISGISFVGYFAMRFFGTRRGLAATGAIGGLASSTAVTLAMAGRVREALEDRGVMLAAAFGVVMANAIMIIRVLLEVAAINRPLVSVLWRPMVLVSVAGLLSAAVLGVLLARQGRSVRDLEATEEDPAEELELDNPFRLGPALKFGVLFVIIIGVVHLAELYFGDRGLYVAALISGLADADATGLSAARMHATGELEAVVAVRTVIIAALSNSLVKAGIGAFLGSLRFGLVLLVCLLPSVLVGVWAMFFLV